MQSIHQLQLMTGQRLFQYLSDMYPLTADFRSELEKCVTQLTLPKNHLLVEAPKIAGHLYFLERGFALAYTFLEARKQIERFWTEGEMIVSVKSFFEQVPSREYVQLVSDSDVLFISHADADRLFNRFKEARYLYRSIMNRYYEREHQRILDLQHLTARDRYTQLKDAFPGIEQLVSQEYIASYIGITPQSLSRMKSPRNNLSDDK